MSFFSSVKSAVTNYAKNVAGGAKIVGGAISNALSGSKQPANALSGATSTQAPIPNFTIAPGVAPQTISAATKSNVPSFTLSNGVSLGSINSSGGTSTTSPSYTGDSPIYGTSINSTSSPTLTSFASSSLPSTINSSVLAPFSPSGSTNTIAVPSAPSVSNPGPVNNGGLISSLSDTHTYNPDTNQFIVKPPVVLTPEEKLAQQRASAQQALIENIPQKESVLGSPEVQNQLNVVDNQKKIVADYTSQLNSIVAGQQASLIRESDAIAKAGGTEAAWSGREAQINHEAAIAALPVQAQIATAQGNLSIAQDYLTQLTTWKSEESTNKYNHQMAIYDSLKGFTTKEEDIALDKLRTDQSRAYQERQNNIQRQDKYFGLASAQNRPDLISAINALNPDNPNFNNQLTSLTSHLVDTSSGVIYKKDASGNVLRDASGKPMQDVTPQTQALQVILGSGKFTKDQVSQITNAINNGQDPFTVIKNQGKALMSGTAQTKVENYEVAQATLNNIAQQLSQFYAQGGKTSLISGNFEKVINKLGEVKDPKLVDLATQIQGNIQVYRNAISGTAYSAQEGKDIASIFPGINKSAELNNAILKARETLFNSVIDSSYRSVLGPAYDKLKNGGNTSVTIPKGQTTLYQGHTYVSDGTQWVLQK